MHLSTCNDPSCDDSQTIDDSFVIGEALYLVMDLASSGDLKELLDQRKKDSLLFEGPEESHYEGVSLNQNEI